MSFSWRTSGRLRKRKKTRPIWPVPPKAFQRYRAPIPGNPAHGGQGPCQRSSGDCMRPQLARKVAPHKPKSLRIGSVDVAQRDGGHSSRGEKEHTPNVTQGA